MINKGLTMSLVFEAESANYGEGMNNITILKKLTRGDGNTYSYISRQALRYSIVQQLGYDNTPIEVKTSGENENVQFSADANIKDYPEIDLFGYMRPEKDKKADTRNAIVRLSNAISLEAYNSDMDYLNNMGLAKRKNAKNAIVYSEIHKSYYSYTIAIDLDRIGIDVNAEIEISKEEKINRIQSLLKTVQFLYRDIRGRRENLAPVFVIGGIYERKNPFFENRIKVDKNKLDVKILKDIINSDNDVKDNTEVGYMENIFANSDEINSELATIGVGKFFENLIKKVEEVF